MIYFLLAVIAGLYVLGSYQGSTIADVCDAELEEHGAKLDVPARFALTCLWPYTTIRAMFIKDDDNDE